MAWACLWSTHCQSSWRSPYGEPHTCISNKTIWQKLSDFWAFCRMAGTWSGCIADLLGADTLSILMNFQLGPAGFQRSCRCRLCTLQLAECSAQSAGLLFAGRRCVYCDRHTVSVHPALHSTKVVLSAGGMGSSTIKHSIAEWQLPPWPARNRPRAAQSARARRSASCLTSRCLLKGELQSRLSACTARANLPWHTKPNCSRPDLVAAGSL